MLHRLALAGRRPLGDGARDEEDELTGSESLEVAKAADVGGVSQHYRVRRLGRRRRRGGGIEDHQRRNPHPGAPLVPEARKRRKRVGRTQGKARRRDRDERRDSAPFDLKLPHALRIGQFKDGGAVRCGSKGIEPVRFRQLSDQFKLNQIKNNNFNIYPLFLEPIGLRIICTRHV